MKLRRSILTGCRTAPSDSAVKGKGTSQGLRGERDAVLEEGNAAIGLEGVPIPDDCPVQSHDGIENAALVVRPVRMGRWKDHMAALVAD